MTPETQGWKEVKLVLLIAIFLSMWEKPVAAIEMGQVETNRSKSELVRGRGAG